MCIKYAVYCTRDNTHTFSTRDNAHSKNSKGSFTPKNFFLEVEQSIELKEAANFNEQGH